MLITSLLLALVAAGAALALWRWRDHRADRAVMDRLVSTQPESPALFDPSMLAGLPEPARRFFLYTIAPGAALYPVANIDMRGQFALGTKAEPRYFEMRATQVLAMPAGFVWKMSASRGLMRLSGSDSAHWTRFWMLGLLPVARLGGGLDHRRSAFGRYVAEAVFWAPAAMLPGPGVQWQPVDANCARVSVTHRGLTQSVDVTVAPDGQPTHVCFQRWSDANPEKRHRLQPFGGYLSAFREFAGYRLPTHVEAGNHFGTAEYFPFLLADVTSIVFPQGN